MLLMLSGCAAPWQQLDEVAAQGGLSKRIIAGSEFDEVVYRRALAAAAGPLIVFLEGDGLPWAGPKTVSADPTARNPIGLRLALETPGNVAYLARPCYQEFTHGRGCDSALWTQKRYAPEVVVSMASAIRALDSKGTTPIWLVGYSGGGTLAVLIAPRIASVERVITVAADLDTDAWTAVHHYIQLTGSLNPAQLAPLPARIQQVHLYGGHDVNIAPGTIQRFSEGQPSASTLRLASFDHVCCWVRDWPQIWENLAVAR